MEIIPAIIAKSFEELETKMSAVAGLVPSVQVDVLDGSLVPGIRAWPYLKATRTDADLTRTDAEKDSHFKAIVLKQEGFPFWEKLEFEAHLMVREPERIISDWISAGASRIIVQYEGVGNFDKCIKEVSGRVPLGISIALDTPRGVTVPIADKIEVIQCMGWNFSSLGRQGQPFDPKTIEAVRELRKLYPEHIISVDGGVSLDTAPALISAGADRIIVGSAIWNGGMVRENLEQFKKFSKTQ